MINLSEIFIMLAQGLQNHDRRYSVVDETTVKDSDSGLTYHFHPESTGKPWEVTHNADVVITGQDLTAQESEYAAQAAKLVSTVYTEAKRGEFKDLWLEGSTKPKA